MTVGKAARGTIAMAGANALRLAAQFLILPMIARVLGPDVYGVIALATPFIFFLIMFGDLGLGPALVRSAELTPELESTAFWTSLASGFALMLLLAALASPIGHLLGRPEISPILFSFSPLLLLVSASEVPVARLQREGKFAAMAAIDISSVFAGMAAAVYGCYAGLGVWSLVAQQFALWLCRTGSILVVSGFKPKLVFRLSLVKSSLSFSAGIVGVRVIGLLSDNIDNVLIGAFLGTAILGCYSIAYQVINVPSLVFGAVHFSLFPAFSAAHHRGEALAQTYLGATRALLLMTAPAMVGLALTADLLVPLVLGASWEATASIIQLLVPFGLLRLMFLLNSALLLGAGRSDLEFSTTALRAGSIVVGILAGLPWGGQGVALGISICFAISGYWYTRTVIRTFGISGAELWHTAKAPLVSCGLLALGVFALRFSALPQMTLFSALIVSVVSGFLIYFSTLYFCFRADFMSDLATVRNLMTKSSR